MLKIIQTMALLYFCITLSACSTLDSEKPFKRSNIQWDFDHGLQFRQTKISTNSYQLEVIPNNKTHFERLATFLIRKSYSLCGGYHYKMEMIQGIEGFDDKRAMPNYIFPSLMAKVECKPKLNKGNN